MKKKAEYNPERDLYMARIQLSELQERNKELEERIIQQDKEILRIRTELQTIQMEIQKKKNWDREREERQGQFGFFSGNM